MPDNPIPLLAFAIVLALLILGAALRVRRDRRLKQRRALTDRRQAPRPQSDRRWQARPRV